MRRFGNYIETDTGLSGYEPLVVLGRELEELSTVVLPHFWQQPRRGVRRLARVVAGNQGHRVSGGRCSRHSGCESQERTTG